MVDFSIITPVFNGEIYLEETINSVLSNLNSRFSYEYLIIDDGSTDSTREILLKYSHESIIKVFSITNGGEAAAVNFALDKAVGKYVIVVNADDPLVSSKLFYESHVALDGDLNIIVAYPDWNVISDDNRIIETKKLPDYSLDLLVGEFRCLPGPGTVFRRSAALKIGGRNTAFKFVSDYDFWLRMSQEGAFIHIPDVLAQWREHTHSTSVASRGFEMGLERINVMEDFLKNSDFDVRQKRKAISHAYYNAALLAYFSSSVPGRKWMIEALKKRRGWIEKSDIRVVLFCLLLPFSRKMLKIVSKIPFINTPIKKSS
jgi:glycosyltransferase involved in cell wall biosynthesis